MNAEEINKKIQTEKDSFNRNLNRLQKQIFELTNATNVPWNIGKDRKNKLKLIKLLKI